MTTTPTPADWTTRNKWGVPLAAARPREESEAHEAAQASREESRWNAWLRNRRNR